MKQIKKELIPFYPETVLEYLDTKLFVKRKYAFGLFRDVGHYILIYPIILRLAAVGGLIYSFWSDIDWMPVIAKIITAILYYLFLRWIIPRRNYSSS